MVTIRCKPIQLWFSRTGLNWPVMKPRLVITMQKLRSAEGYCSECNLVFFFEDDPRPMDSLYGAFRKHVFEAHSSEKAS